MFTSMKKRMAMGEDVSDKKKKEKPFPSISSAAKAIRDRNKMNEEVGKKI